MKPLSVALVSILIIVFPLMAYHSIGYMADDSKPKHPPIHVCPVAATPEPAVDAPNPAISANGLPWSTAFDHHHVGQPGQLRGYRVIYIPQWNGRVAPPPSQVPYNAPRVQAQVSRQTKPSPPKPSPPKPSPPTKQATY